MNREIIQKSLDYIEENLKCEITARELCERAGFSLFHYYRLFHTAVGMPVMQYILRRKLLNAIYEISRGEKMIDVALAYGFETHAGFYKAFVRELGCTFIALAACDCQFAISTSFLSSLTNRMT